VKPEPIERIVSLALAAAIPAATGVALLLTLPPGDGWRGGKPDGGDGVLVVEMLPLETASASMATGAPPASKVKNVWIAASSGRTNLDAEALAAIRRAVPMPKIPSDLPDSLDITLPIDFQIG